LLGTLEVDAMFNARGLDQFCFPIDLLHFTLMGQLFLLREFVQFDLLFVELLLQVGGLGSETAQFDVDIRLVELFIL
jgi:hypothetical protein